MKFVDQWKNDEYCRDIFRKLPDGITLANPEGIILMATPKSLELFGNESETEVIGTRLLDWVAPASREKAEANLARLFQGENPVDNEYYLLKKDGSTYIGAVNGALVYDEKGLPEGLIVTVRDISDKRMIITRIQEQEEQLQRLNRIYAVISRMQKAIAKADSTKELFSNACKISVKEGKLTMAWIGLVNSRTGQVKVVAHAGLARDYLKKLRIKVSDGKRGAGPTGRAIVSGEPVVCNDIAHDPDMAPWRDDALRIGYRSSGAFPLIVEDQVIGSINLYAPEPGFFTTGEIRMLTELAADISYAVENIRNLEKREQSEKEATEWKAELDRYFESSLDLLCITDTDGYFRRLNPEWEKTLRYPLSELIGKRFLDLVHPDDYAATEEAIATLASQQEVLNFTNRYRCRDGSYKYIEWRSYPAGKFIYAVARDITAREQAEQRDAASRMLYKNLFDNSMDAILLTSPDGAILDANPAACDMFRRSVDEIRKLGRKGLVDETDQRLAKALEERARTGKTFAEFTMIRAGGEKFPAEVSSVIFPDPHGRQRTCMIIRDITKRKESEKALTERLKELETIHRTSQLLQKLVSPEELAINIIRILEHFLNYRYAAVLFIEESTGDLIPFAVSNQGKGKKFVEQDKAYISSHHIRIGTGITGNVALTGKSYISGEVSTEPDYKILRPGILSELCVPVRMSGKVIGVINIETDQPNAYDQNDQRVLETIASQFSISVQNSRLLEQVEQQVHEISSRESRYRTLFESANDAIFILKEGLFYNCNESAVVMFGCQSKRELIGHSPVDFSPVHQPDGKESNRSAYEHIQFAEEGAKRRFYWRHIRKDGEEFDTEVSLNRIDLREEKLIQAIVRDITETLRVQEKLKQSEERYRIISSVASDYMFSSMITGDGTLKLNWVAGAFEKITGYAFDEYEAMGGWRRTVHPDDLEIDNRDMAELNHNHDIITELRTLRKDGAIVWIRVYAHPVWDEENDRLAGIYGAVHDISQQKKISSDLQESEEKFFALFERAPIAVSLSDFSNGRLVEVNEAFSEQFGFTKEESIGKTTSELELNPDEETRRKILADLRKKDPVRNLEMALCRKSGERRTMLVNIDHILIRGQWYLLNTAIDITERKLAESRLRESESNYRLLVENQTDLIVKVDPEGRFLFVSPSYCRMFGKEENELLGRPFLPLVHEEDREPTKKAMEKLFKPPFSTYLEQRAWTAQGWLWMAWVDTAVLDSEGRVIEIIGVGRDITLQKKAETALRISENKFRSVLENVNLITLMLDKQANIIFANNYFLQLTGWKRDEVLNKNWFDLFIPKEIKNEIKEVFINAIELDKLGKFHTNEILTRNGEKRLIQWSNITHYTAEQKPDFITSIGEDITERKQSEELLRLSLNRLIHTEEEVRKEASEQLHDHVGQNLTALIIDLNFIKNHFSATAGELVVNRLNESLRLLEDTIDRTRDIMTELRPSILDDYGLYAALNWSGGKFTDRTGIPVRLSGKEQVKRAPREIEYALFRMVQEALHNVMKHARAKTVFIELKTRKKKITLTIRDNGIGFDPTLLTDRKRTTGFGLTNMTERMKSLGGRAEVISAPGKGTTVVLEIRIM